MLEQIYAKLTDQKSKDIFKSRLLFSLTGDYTEICKIVADTDQAAEIRRKINLSEDRQVFIWGTGFWGNYLIKSFPDIDWRGYVDNSPRESVKNGMPVYSSQEFLKMYSGQLILIATAFYHEEIYHQLLSHGIGENKIINAGKLMVDLFDNQYFDLPFLTHAQDEVFVDAGCFDGLTVRNFIKWSGGKYREIISFEPDAMCLEKCRALLKDVENLTLENTGLWSSNGVLSFHATGSSDSQIAKEGETRITTGMLDEIAGDRRITFIKMDIEGAEKEALIGAQNIIKNQKPKLAVSIYHKKEDIWELPKLLLEMNPEYRFYLRHYSLREAETVLYAV
ncbi:MAG: FkbM family methyltransferase [Lachnospiraceae bacterium]|nr:FkbM family methyltransferase [Lachnospiraceae bacterium]